MSLEGFLAHIRERTSNISRKEILFILGMGVADSLLLLPTLQNISVPALLESFGVSFPLFVVLLVIAMPVLLLLGAYFLCMLPFRGSSAAQLARYAVVGSFNVALNAAIFNTLILVSGISDGLSVTAFAVITFVIVVTQSFFWSVYWTFKNAPEKSRSSQYAQFFGVSSTVAVVNISIIHVLVNVIGAPAGISGPIWANIALLLTIFTALLGNFLGYKYLVFRH